MEHEQARATTVITALPEALRGKIVRVVDGHEIDSVQREGFELAGVVATEVHLNQIGIDTRTKYLMVQNPESAATRLTEQIERDRQSAQNELAAERARTLIYRNAYKQLADSTRDAELIAEVDDALKAVDESSAENIQ